MVLQQYFNSGIERLLRNALGNFGDGYGSDIRGIFGVLFQPQIFVQKHRFDGISNQKSVNDIGNNNSAILVFVTYRFVLQFIKLIFKISIKKLCEVDFTQFSFL